MLNNSGVIDKGNKAYKDYVADYHMNLVSVEELDETLFHTGLHELVGFLKRRNDKQGLMEFLEQDKERIQNMDGETFDAVRIMLNLPASITRHRDETEKEDHNMCRAFEEWLADERNAGIEEGQREGLKKGRREGLEERRKKGEKRFANLTSALIAAGRLGDLTKAACDETFRESLYQEYAL